MAYQQSRTWLPLPSSSSAVKPRKLPLALLMSIQLMEITCSHNHVISSHQRPQHVLTATVELLRNPSVDTLHRLQAASAATTLKLSVASDTQGLAHTET